MAAGFNQTHSLNIPSVLALIDLPLFAQGLRLNATATGGIDFHLTNSQIGVVGL